MSGTAEVKSLRGKLKVTVKVKKERARLKRHLKICDQLHKTIFAAENQEGEFL